MQFNFCEENFNNRRVKREKLTFQVLFLSFNNRMNKGERGNLNFNLIKFTLGFPVCNYSSLYFFSLLFDLFKS